MMFNYDDKERFEGFNLNNAVCLRYKDKPVYFLLTRRGDALTIHVRAEGRKGKLSLRDGCRAIVESVPSIYPWCRMLIAGVDGKSVYNLCIKLGFTDCGYIGNEVGKFRLMVIRYG